MIERFTMGCAKQAEERGDLRDLIGGKSSRKAAKAQDTRKVIKSRYSIHPS
jgi:hypothetical protein